MPEEPGLADVIEQRELLSRLRAGLDGAAPAAPGWARVVDVQVTRTGTEWALPGLLCPCCGTAAIAAPPPGAHAGSVSYGPALNAAAVVLTSYGNVSPERAGHVVDMLLGVRVSAGWVDKADARLSGQLEQAGFDAAMCAALAAEPVLATRPTSGCCPGSPASSNAASASSADAVQSPNSAPAACSPGPPT